MEMLSTKNRRKKMSYSLLIKDANPVLLRRTPGCILYSNWIRNFSQFSILPDIH